MFSQEEKELMEIRERLLKHYEKRCAEVIPNDKFDEVTFKICDVIVYASHLMEEAYMCIIREALKTEENQ